MPYFGYLEIEVRLMREGHGVEGKEVAPVATRKVRIEERHAKFIGRSSGPGDEEAAAESDRQVDKVEAAIAEVLDEDEMFHLQDRWRAATQGMTSERMKRALEALEG